MSQSDKAGNGRRQKKAQPGDVYAGLRLRQLRIARGISQNEIANHLGVTFQQVQKYEKGVNRLSPARVATIAKFLGVGVTEFFQPSDEEGQAGDHALLEIISTRPGVRMGTAFVRLAPHVQDLLVDITELLAAATKK